MNMEILGTIIVALLSLVGTLGGSYLTNRKTTTLLEYRMDKLEEKLDEFNELIDRVYKLEGRVSVVEEKVKNMKEDNKYA